MAELQYTRWSHKPSLAVAADHLAWTARAVWTYARWSAVSLVALQILLALLPAASVRVTQRVMDGALAVAGRGPAALVRLVPWLAAWAVAAILSGGVAFQVRKPLTERVNQELRGALGRLRLEKAARLSLLDFERSELYDQMALAGDGSAALELFFSACHALAYGIQALALVALFWPVAHWLPVALALSLVVRSGRQAERSRRDQSFVVDQTEDQRRVAYVGGLLTGVGQQKELRVFRLQQHLAGRWIGLRRSVRAALLGQKRRNALFALPTDALSFVVVAGTAVLLALALGRRSITVGAFVALFGGVGKVENAGTQFAFQFAQGNSCVMQVGYFRQFLDLPEEPAPPAATPCPTPLREGIRCEGLTFTYPGRNAAVPRALDLHLRPGERVALVGENTVGRNGDTGRTSPPELPSPCPPRGMASSIRSWPPSSTTIRSTMRRMTSCRLAKSAVSNPSPMVRANVSREARTWASLARRSRALPIEARRSCRAARWARQASIRTFSVARSMASAA